MGAGSGRNHDEPRYRGDDSHGLAPTTPIPNPRLGSVWWEIRTRLLCLAGVRHNLLGCLEPVSLAPGVSGHCLAASADIRTLSGTFRRPLDTCCPVFGTSEF